MATQTAEQQPSQRVRSTGRVRFALDGSLRAGPCVLLGRPVAAEHLYRQLAAQARDEVRGGEHRHIRCT